MITWTPTDEKTYDEMLGVLPPAATDGHGAFLVGEPMDHRNGRPTFSAFKRHQGQYYASAEPVTFPEFQADRPGAEYYYD